jgi:hypothetical protein
MYLQNSHDSFAIPHKSRTNSIGTISFPLQTPQPCFNPQLDFQYLEAHPFNLLQDPWLWNTTSTGTGSDTDISASTTRNTPNAAATVPFGSSGQGYRSDILFQEQLMRGLPSNEMDVFAELFSLDSLF